MKKKVVLAIIDGTIWGLSVYLLTEYSVSSWAKSLESQVIISHIMALLTSVFSVIQLAKTETTKDIGIYFLGSAVSSCFSLILIFTNYMTIGLHCFPQRPEINNGDGLWLIVILFFFVFWTVILRTTLFVFFLVRNVRKRKERRFHTH